MIRINLLPTKEAERALGARNQRALLALGISAMVLVMLIPYLWQSNKLGRLQRDTDNVQRLLERLTEQVKEVENLDRLKAEARAKLEIIADLEGRRTGPANVIDALSKATPDSLWLTHVTESGGRVRLRGISLDNETIAEFMKKLETCRPSAARGAAAAAADAVPAPPAGEAAAPPAGEAAPAPKRDGGDEAAALKDVGCYFHQIDLIASEDARDAKAQGFKQFEVAASVDFFGTGGRREALREAAAAKEREKKGKDKGKDKDKGKAKGGGH